MAKGAATVFSENKYVADRRSVLWKREEDVRVRDDVRSIFFAAGPLSEVLVTLIHDSNKESKAMSDVCLILFKIK